jgi:hypothetical protein
MLLSLFVWSVLAGIIPPRSSNNTNSVYPDLLEATTEELADGLKKGLFTSVDLVNVRFIRMETTFSLVSLLQL